MRSLIFLARQQGMGESTYQLTDRLHDGRTARVTAEVHREHDRRRGSRSWVQAVRSSRTSRGQCETVIGFMSMPSPRRCRST